LTEGLSWRKLNMNNTALIIACVASVGGCLGAAYLADKISPVPPIRDKDILETTSIAGIATLTKSAVAPLVQNSEDPKEIFNLYLAKTVTLEDALEMLLKKGNDVGIKDLYTSVISKRNALPEDSDERAYYNAFVKALEKYYPSLKHARLPPTAPPVDEEPPIRLPPTAPPVEEERLPPTAPPVEEEETPSGPPPDEEWPRVYFAHKDETSSRTGGARRRHGTQKHRHPVIRSILCADA
jgi:hypothetical protein